MAFTCVFGKILEGLSENVAKIANWSMFEIFGGARKCL